MRLLTFLMAGLLGSSLVHAQAGNELEAVRLNNRGVAEMGQQFTERAAASFTQSFARDSHLAQASINRGIALLTLQKVEEAKAAFEMALQLNPRSAQAWYNLGLAEHAANELEPALASFKHAIENDPKDVDSYYFAGVCLQELKELDQAMGYFNQALKLDPLHASAEFALARSLQRSGHSDEAKLHFKRFQHLSSTKIGSPIGLAYGEQGHYSTVTPIEEPERPLDPMIPVHFEARPLLGAQKPATNGAACMMDLTGSGVMDLLLVSEEPQAIVALHSDGKGGYTPLKAEELGLKLTGHAVACAVGDFDGDERNDLAVATEEAMHLFRNLGNGKFEEVTEKAGLSVKNHPTGIGFIDYDHDGDLDLFVTGSSLTAGGNANVLWRNNGNGTFTEWTDPTGLGGTGKTEAAILTDFNNDRAVDIAVSGDGASPLIYVNPREGKYPTQAIFADAKEKLAATRGIAVLDYDKDGAMDIAVTHAAAPGLTLWHNVQGEGRLGRRFERVELPLKDALGAWGLTAVDIDNDGWIDLAVLVSTKSGPCVRVLRNRGNGSFEDVSHALGLDAVVLHDPRALIAVPDQGVNDLLVTERNGSPLLLRNHGAEKHHALRLDLTGFADNKTAIGSKVEIFVRGHWQKWEVAGASGYMSQSPQQLLVGLGDSDGIDLLRILWPTGVLQDEIDLPHQPVIAMKEADRRGSSCPVLFTWNGHKFELVTDVIGAGVVGHWFTPTRRNIPNPGEWIKVDGRQLAPVETPSGARMSLRFIEPMEEVNYIDQLRLVAIDHPENVEVNPDERFLDDPPFASGRVIASAATKLPAGAWDGEGRDVLELLSHADHKFASGFKATPYDGFANLHALTLDLGSVDVNQPLRLLMTGYVNYFSATSLYAAWQAGIEPISSYVEAERADGSWQRIPGDAGFPAGLERTIVVDLSGKLPAGTRRIRLMSNLEIYWDEVRIDNHPEATYRATEIPLASAHERFRGYPRQIDGSSPGDLQYDYDEVSLTGPFQHQRGNYTRLGNVTELLSGIDNRMAIFGSGEELAAEFDASQLPHLPAHWKRDYFFYANGYVKDMDWWDSTPFTVAQLPFHGMSRYPYPEGEGFPADHLEYQLDWNTRWDSGEPVRSYHFNYQKLPETPAADCTTRSGQSICRAEQ